MHRWAPAATCGSVDSGIDTPGPQRRRSQALSNDVLGRNPCRPTLSLRDGLEFGREMGDGSCCVCKEAPPKYKCPSCRTPYCSVTCFKKHKEESCQKILHQEEISKSALQEEVTLHTTCTAESPNTACPTKALEVEDLSWLVDNNRLRSLAELKGIHDALRDPELQRMILQIDGSSEPEKELEKVMEGQAFREFTDKILDIVNPQE